VSLQTDLQTNHATQHDTERYKPASSHQEFQIGAQDKSLNGTGEYENLRTRKPLYPQLTPNEKHAYTKLQQSKGKGTCYVACYTNSAALGGTLWSPKFLDKQAIDCPPGVPTGTTIRKLAAGWQCN
jgi:hypothetical protein